MFTSFVTEGLFWISTVMDFSYFKWTRSWFVQFGYNTWFGKKYLVLYMVLMCKLTFVFFSVGSIDLSLLSMFNKCPVSFELDRQEHISAKHQLSWLVLPGV